MLSHVQRTGELVKAVSTRISARWRWPRRHNTHCCVGVGVKQKVSACPTLLLKGFFKQEFYTSPVQILYKRLMIGSTGTKIGKILYYFL